MDSIRYAKETTRKMDEFEHVCTRCGACCGSEDGDPCKNLLKNGTNTYICRTYKNRLGPQETLSGKFFNCVEIKNMINDGCLRNTCAYFTRN